METNRFHWHRPWKGPSKCHLARGITVDERGLEISIELERCVIEGSSWNPKPSSRNSEKVLERCEDDASQLKGL